MTTPEYPIDSGPKARDRFLTAIRKIVSVPKSEIEKRERKYKEERRRKKR